MRKNVPPGDHQSLNRDQDSSEQTAARSDGHQRVVALTVPAASSETSEKNEQTNDPEVWNLARPALPRVFNVNPHDPNDVYEKLYRLFIQLGHTYVRQLHNAWMYGICLYKRKEFPHTKPHKIPPWWPNTDVCPYSPSWDMEKRHRIEFFIHFLRLRPSAETLEAWNKTTSQTVYVPTADKTGSWTAFLKAITPEPRLTDRVFPEAVRYWKKMLRQIFWVADLEEQVAAGGNPDPSNFTSKAAPKTDGLNILTAWQMRKYREEALAKTVEQATSGSDKSRPNPERALKKSNARKARASAEPEAVEQSDSTPSLTVNTASPRPATNQGSSSPSNTPQPYNVNTAPPPQAADLESRYPSNTSQPCNLNTAPRQRPAIQESRYPSKIPRPYNVRFNLPNGRFSSDQVRKISTMKNSVNAKAARSGTQRRYHGNTKFFKQLPQTSVDVSSDDDYAFGKETEGWVVRMVASPTQLFEAEQDSVMFTNHTSGPKSVVPWGYIPYGGQQSRAVMHNGKTWCASANGDTWIPSTEYNSAPMDSVDTTAVPMQGLDSQQLRTPSPTPGSPFRPVRQRLSFGLGITYPSRRNVPSYNPYQQANDADYEHPFITEMRREYCGLNDDEIFHLHHHNQIGAPIYEAQDAFEPTNSSNTYPMPGSSASYGFDLGSPYRYNNEIEGELDEIMEY